MLLAIMAFPLARTLTGGEQAPPAEVSVLSDAAQNPVAANSSAMPEQSAEATAAVTPTESAEPEAPAPLALGTAQTEPEAMQPAPPGHLTDAVPLDGEGASTLTPGAPAQDAAAFSPKDVAASTNASPAAPSISVPDTIQPQALADAARNGDQLALFEIGARYTEGRNGLAADQAQAANWYQLAADKGFAPAQYRLGSMYEKGTGVARDIGKAKAFYEQAANQGNASAMHNLAVLYAPARSASRTTRPRQTGSPRPPISASPTANSTWRSFAPAATAWRRTSAKATSGSPSLPRAATRTPAPSATKWQRR
ncbi:hypothetical protein AJ87_05530 [Rhizobium yanglingense]|nr:hypothetical protein AJ87_05530 [Rhizobium yanglingense]